MCVELISIQFKFFMFFFKFLFFISDISEPNQYNPNPNNICFFYGF